MRFSTLALAGAASVVSAQRPSDTPICDYYTTALLKENNATNQATLLTLLVNTVVIGNYTMPNVGVKVPGILAEGKVDDEDVKLAPYFSGALKSTNRGDKPTCVNFLDGGGAEPLMKNMPANDETSNQHFLLTHLYQFFGALLGCSKMGMPGFDSYQGNPSMYKVHKFMDLSNAEMTYFIQQVGMAAASFGVDEADIDVVAKALGDTFNMKCSPPAEVIPGSKELQAICIAEDCKEAENPVCDQYDESTEPEMCSMMSSMMPTGTGSMMPTGTGSMMPTGTGSMMPTGTGPGTVPTDNAAPVNNFGVAAVVAAAAAYIL